MQSTIIAGTVTSSMVDDLWWFLF